ncbi:MAG: acid phosphatase [Verrucomicrobia bacterium]|nr:acid phosphatase [Verrucomicrobiota bacterium]
MRKWFWVMLGVGLIAATAVAQEPRNLGLLKRELYAYVESGSYQRDIAVVAKDAAAWIERRAAQAKPGERFAVVFDLDDTLWSGWSELSGFDFGWNEASWAAWIAAAKAPAIEPVAAVYRLAQRRGVAVIFLSTRRESQRADTVRNLKAVGCAESAALVLQPDGDKRTAAAFKTAERQRLVAEGYVIIANVGDQASDLVGGFAEKTFKVPNPFYLTE